MSLVVALKQKDRIILGSDSQVSVGGNKSHACTKIWEVKGLPGALMGGVGTARASQIIQYADIIDKNEFAPTTEYIVTSLVPIIANTLKANGFVIDPTPESEIACVSIPNSFIFAYADKAWMIWSDLSVQEITEDYMIIGSGSDVARGVLYATQNMTNPFLRIKMCIEAAAESTLYVDDNVDLLATGTYANDVKLIAKAFNIEMDSKKEEKEKKEPNEISEPVSEQS